MMEFIGMLLVAFLSAFGLVWLICTLVICFACDKERGLYILIPADSACRDLEIKILEAQMQIQRMGGRSIKKIIVLDNGMSDEMRKVALKKVDENNSILIMTADELQKLI